MGKDDQVRSLSIVRNHKKFDVEISNENWSFLEEAEMPGISLGYLFEYRERVEEKLEEHERLPFFFDANGKIDIKEEIISTVYYIYCAMQSKLAEELIDKVHALLVHAYYVIAKEMDVPRIVVDLDQAMVYQDK